MSDAVINNSFHRWRTLWMVTLFIVMCAVIVAVIAPFTSKLQWLTPEILIGSVGTLGAFALTVLFVRRDRLRLSDVGAAPDWRSPARFACGLLVGVAMVATSALISIAFGHIQLSRVSEVGIVAIATQLLGYILLAAREELAFRGYPLRRLEKTFGLWTAQLLVAFIFAFEHKVGGWPWDRALLGAGVGSLMFGMATLVTKGLAVPTGIHAAWNFGQWTFGLNGSPGIWSAVVEQGQEQAADQVRRIGYLVVMGIATLGFWLWYRKTRHRTEVRVH